MPSKEDFVNALTARFPKDKIKVLAYSMKDLTLHGFIGYKLVSHLWVNGNDVFVNTEIGRAYTPDEAFERAFNSIEAYTKEASWIENSNL